MNKRKAISLFVCSDEDFSVGLERLKGILNFNLISLTYRGVP